MERIGGQFSVRGVSYFTEITDLFIKEVFSRLNLRTSLLKRMAFVGDLGVF